ncbi:9059_t:CDS:2, partial [Ambispora leptoticha]
YEELKNLLPADRACKVPGCYNNYSGSGGLRESNPHLSEEQFKIISNEEVSTKVLNGKCMFHRALEILHINLNGSSSHQETGDQNADNDPERERIKRIIRNALPNNNELKKMLQVNKNNIKSEQTSNEEETGNNPDSETPSGNQGGNDSPSSELINTANKDDIVNIKARVLADIHAKRKAKKAAENITNNLQTEGKDADQLKNQLEEMEKLKGQQSYEDNQSGIDNLKNELAKK